MVSWRRALTISARNGFVYWTSHAAVRAASEGANHDDGSEQPWDPEGLNTGKFHRRAASATALSAALCAYLRGGVCDSAARALALPLVERWPILVPLRVVVGHNRAQQQRVLRPLKTNFGASALPRRSGIPGSACPEFP